MCEMAAMAQDYERTARKDHKCYECNEVIPKGSRYGFHKGLYDGAWYEQKNCVRCDKLFLKVLKAWGEDCLEFGRLKEAYLELLTLDDFDGLVPLKWIEEAKENLRYREKYYYAWHNID